PGTCRPKPGYKLQVEGCKLGEPHGKSAAPDGKPGHCKAISRITHHASRTNWRFFIPDGEIISFTDGNCGLQQLVAGKDFGDFIVWRHDEIPSYQLAVVVDDAAMKISEVVRGEDLLKSTARQLLIYRALGLAPPEFFH